MAPAFDPSDQPDPADWSDSPVDHPAGLCASCIHARVIPHPRGGDPYWRCAKSETDPAFRRFPRLPVRACSGYEEQK